jgi:hypothetical protein
MSPASLVTHAHALGVDLNLEPQLQPVIEDSLACELPYPWEMVEDDECNYYYNRSTGQSTYTHPMDNHYRQVISTYRALASDKDGLPQDQEQGPRPRELFPDTSFQTPTKEPVLSDEPGEFSPRAVAKAVHLLSDQPKAAVPPSPAWSVSGISLQDLEDGDDDDDLEEHSKNAEPYTKSLEEALHAHVDALAQNQALTQSMQQKSLRLSADLEEQSREHEEQMHRMEEDFSVAMEQESEVAARAEEKAAQLSVQLAKVLTLASEQEAKAQEREEVEDGLRLELDLLTKFAQQQAATEALKEEEDDDDGAEHGSGGVARDTSRIRIQMEEDDEQANEVEARLKMQLLEMEKRAQEQAAKAEAAEEAKTRLRSNIEDMGRFVQQQARKVHHDLQSPYPPRWPAFFSMSYFTLPLKNCTRIY